MSKHSKEIKVGLVDADLLDKGTRHPNLALLKIAGLLHDNNIDFELIVDSAADITEYDHIFMSKVFTYTVEPMFYLNASEKDKLKFHIGGTGYYANEHDMKIFAAKREEDMLSLEKDSFLCSLRNKYGILQKPFGIDMAHQMPYYDLYKQYVYAKIGDVTGEELRKRRLRYKDYLDFSIGFLTRKCYRHCPFCVNRLEHGVEEYSRLEWFYDKTKPHVYFWDDNFLAAPKRIWKPLLQQLIDGRISFQFRQGLDERQFAESPDGEEMAMMLSKARYHGDYIFAFDNWRDRKVICKALKIWKKYNPKASTKFYLFCGFRQTADDKKRFYVDIRELFQRIKVLMQYGCIGYIMRHEDYNNSPIPNLYVQIARWCNQPAFYKKMSFWEFCYMNQSYWEANLSPAIKETFSFLLSGRQKLKSFEDFMEDVNSGFYNRVKMCRPLATILKAIDMFPEKREEIISMFSYKFCDLISSQNLEENGK